jgi:intein-encoded DNA endonuclease-like protein
MSNQEIIEFYLEGNSINATGRKFDLTPYKIKKILTKNNISIRTRHEQNILENMKRGKAINHNYFDTLTPENVYYLGFLAADGTVRPNRNEIKIGLSSIDRDFLIEFKDNLKSEREIKDYTTANGFQISELLFSSQKIKEELAKYSIVPNKTELGVSLKNIPEHFKLAFIKGFFDGDGCFTYNEYTKQCSVKFTSHTKGILEEINKYFNNKGNYYQKKYNGICYDLSFSTLPSIEIMKKFYEIKTPCLIRKKEKFNDYLNLRIEMTSKS